MPRRVGRRSHPDTPAALRFPPSIISDIPPIALGRFCTEAPHLP
jgi:hypothetical protein